MIASELKSKSSDRNPVLHSFSQLTGITGFRSSANFSRGQTGVQPGMARLYGLCVVELRYKTYTNNARIIIMLFNDFRTNNCTITFYHMYEANKF
jgi:hypothetical protein